MLKILLIGLKDLRIIFRDRAALLFMLAAPFALTLGMGMVTGRFSGSTGGLQDIPVIIVNLDGDQLGDALEDVFTSAELADLLEPQIGADPEGARRMIDEDKASAAVIIPAGFTRSIIPMEGRFTSPQSAELEPVEVEIYANPARPVGAGVVETIVEEFMSRVDEGRTVGMTAIVQMLSSGLITPAQAEDAGRLMAERAGEDTEDDQTAIRMEVNTSSAEAVEFDILAYIAPGMALMFLMFTVSNGGRSILAERTQGTLPRLMVTPTAALQIMAGKVFGIFMSGVAQMGILIVASALLFRLNWGQPLPVILLVLAAVFAATGWGLLVTAVSRTPAQAANLGSALMLIFGILGGSFTSLDQLPAAVQTLSRITPNAWALDGFTTLALNGSLANILTPLLGLLVMGFVLFVAASFLLGKNLVRS